MSWTRDRRGELLWGGFCVACAVAMLAVPQWQTVPFHWIWITLTFLYGFRRWSTGQTVGVLGAVIVVTTLAMLRPGGLGAGENSAELSEIPLMTCVFLGMVWHVRRRQDAVDEQRRGAEREREFMREAAHTLRTPLTVAHGHAEFVLGGLAPGSAPHRDATVLLDELRRLARISDQLLMLGTAGRTDALLLAPTRLDRLARDVAARWSAASGRQIGVCAPDPVVVLADEQRLRHAVDALVENALHATAQSGSIVLAAQTRDGRAVLEVADSGAGIAGGDVQRIFTRFARGAGAERRPGTGLGLTIVRAIVLAHGGEVSVQSALGQGSTFTLRLGAVAAPDRETAHGVARGGPEPAPHLA
ncbi:MAG: two-component system, OmpR family, sensor kinase [Solirubrobacteraceae bacterium]|jgi:two-component system OmpR family sensor kinase|nr:two-component system, OmpR family, sensor kinase [Solirubrobacteraceae bacterium]